MPSSTERQRRLMALALAKKKNHRKPASPKAEKIMKSMSLKQLQEFARKK